MCDPATPCDDDRLIACETCEGTGRVELGHPNDPSPPSRQCRHCDGLGYVQTEMRPITIEDLDNDDEPF